MEEKKLTSSQIQLARTLAHRFELNIPFDQLCDYEFGKKFIDLFAYDPDKGEMTGLRRVSVMTDYLYYDKDQRHLQFKLEMSAEDVAFMVSILSKYKHGIDSIPREEESSGVDLEARAYAELENKLLD